MLFDTLSNAMVNLRSTEYSKKIVCTIAPASNLIRDVLQTMQRHGYIGNFEFVDDGKSGQFKVKLSGNINNCGAIKPRYAVKVEDIEKYEKRFLPAREFGILILSTSQGVLTHKEAREKSVGGVLLSYVY